MRKKNSSESGAFRPRIFIAFILCSIGASLALAAVTIDLVPGTAVLLSQSSTTSGNGGNTSSTSNMTNIFSPPAYVDYKRTGSEPVVVVDRYPVTTGSFNGQTCTATNPCYPDMVYVDSTEGFGYPAYDFFFKSENSGQSFHLPHNEPTVGGRAIAQGRGGGDGHHAVGTATHRLFFIDLPATNVTMNISDDRGDTFTSDEFASGFHFVDDRQWVAVDETFPGAGAIPASPNVYISFADIGTSYPNTATIALTRSTHDGAKGTFVTDSDCTPANALIDNPNPGATGPAPDNQPTFCPDSNDPTYSVAGPVIVDQSTSGTGASHPHRLYIPFLRCTGDEATHGLVSCGPPYHLYIAYSDDGGTTWRRNPLCNETTHTGPCLGPTDNPRNIFVEMAIDRAGNLYYTWAQKPIVLDANGNDVGGESDIYYAYSTDGGVTWSRAIDLTGERGDSAVWPWMVAGDPGQVDLVFYKANCGENPPTADACVWNVYFSQSQNALNTGANFKSVQISDHPNHIGPICLSGLGCNSGRTLGDFFTMDIDHLGAANVVWADDNDSRGRTFIKFSRQLSGNSVFKSTPIGLMNDWPIRDHTSFDLTGDVVTPTSSKGLSPSCASLDIQQMSASRFGDLLTVTLTLAAPPSALAATTCAAAGEIPAVADGGFWGAEWWSSATDPSTGVTANDNFYVAYIDEPAAPAHVEAGRLNRSSFPSLTGNEPHFVENGTLGGTCTQALPPSPCTITMTASLTGLGIKSGAGLYSLTGLSLYITGNSSNVPFTNVEEGYTSLGDSTPAIDYNGTGTTP